MTISSTTRIAGPFTGNGTASTFPFTFKVFAAADLDVVRLNSSTGVESTLVLNSDYSVTLNGDQNSNPGGSITLLAGALATGFTLVITSDIANLQPTDLTNQGGFYPEVITDSLDRATIQIQQISDIGDRTIKIPITDGSLNMEMPVASSRANKYLVFDANGLPSVSAGSGTDTALRTDLANATVALAGSNLVGFRANSASSTARTVMDKLRDVVSVKDFGAVGDGVADDTAAIQAAFAAGDNIVFPDGSYLVTGAITKVSNDVSVDFGNATIINGGVLYPFVFGAFADTPQNVGLRITGGRFTQANPSTSSNLNYLLVRAIRKFVIDGCNMDNVSNGGITVYAGAADGVISNVTVNGATAHSTIRGIWLNGGTASDYASQLVDTASISRNATALPAYAVDNVKITDCTITVAAYGIYLINARDCSIAACSIDISGTGALRCIAINNYSPRCRVNGCELMSDRSSTGILVTQCSDDVVISGNVFRGSFGGNRAIYVQYLASAFIAGNRFSDLGTQHIQVDMGGFACVRNNEFVRASYTANNRAVYATMIEPANANTAQGSTAGIIANSGVIFENNLLSRVPVGVQVDTTIAANNANTPSMQIIQASGNTMLNMDLCTVSGERILSAATNLGANVVQLRNERNVVFPLASGGRTAALTSGTAFVQEATQATLAVFEVDNQASLGSLTTTKLAGNAISMTASRSGTDLIIVPRTLLGASGAAVPSVLGITDAGGATLPRTYVVTPSGSNYVVRAYDSAGTQLSFSVEGIKFRVLLGPVPSGT